MQKRYVIIAAGGKGTRMNSDLPKQFHLLDGRPILMNTIDCFATSSNSPEILVALHRDMQTYWADLCSQYHFVSPHRVLDGGESRFQSVKNGIMKILASEKSPLEDILIAIHDAARPVVSAQVIAKCFTETAIHGATTLAVQSTNSVRLGDMQHSEATNRERVWIIQTPQTFKASILKEAFAQPELATFTDDASVVEKMGYRIHLIPGEYSNLKITFPEDIAIAQLYLHALKAKRPLV